MDLNRLSREADDLIRKVVSRYNQLYVPAGNISQVELDLMLDDLRKLFDTFKTIGQVNVTLQQKQHKPEVSVQTPAHPIAQQIASTEATESLIPSETQEATTPLSQPEPESTPTEAAQPILNRESEPEPAAAVHSEPENILDLAEEPEDETDQEVIPKSGSQTPSAYERESAIDTGKSEKQETVFTQPEKTEPASTQTGTPAMLADKFNSGNKTFSETIVSAPANDVVGGRLLFQPIADLTTGIGLNDKFNFISELFGNNQVQYDEAISRINKAVNMDEANWILQKYHSTEWDEKQEAVKRMKDFIRRRFI